jgi:hypothetical protein
MEELKFRYRKVLEDLEEICNYVFICLEQCQVINEAVRDDYYEWKQRIGSPFLELYSDYLYLSYNLGCTNGTSPTLQRAAMLYQVVMRNEELEQTIFTQN